MKTVGKGVYSSNFVSIHESDFVRDVLDIISELNPEYVVIKRRVGQTIYRYVFLASLLKKYLTSERLNPSTRLSELGLHEYESTETKELQTKPTSNDDPEIKNIANEFKSHDNESGRKIDFLIIKHGNDVAGIIDPQRNQKERNYSFRGIEERFVANEPPVTSKGVRMRSLRRFRGGSILGKKNQEDDFSTSVEMSQPMAMPPPKPASTPMDLPTLRTHNRDLKRIERYPHCEIPSEIEKLQKAELKITFLMEKPSERATQTKVAAPAIAVMVEQDEEISFTIEAFSEPSNVIEFPDGNKKMVNIPQDKDSDTVSFTVVGKEVGWCIIRCEFFFKGTIAGLTQVKLNVVEKIQSGKDVVPSTDTGQMEVQRNLQTPDLSIRIREEKKDGDLHFKFTIESEAVGYVPAQDLKETTKITTDPEKYFRELFKDIEDKFHVSDKNQNKDEVNQFINDRLQKKGIKLYTDLFPEEFKRFYWANRDKIRTISIMSDEPWVPWEIIRPEREINGKTEVDEFFFCERFAISRWLNGKLYKKKPQIKSIKVIVPDGINLPAAVAEWDWIDRESAQKGYLATKDSTYTQIKSALQTGGFDLLHFATHAAYNTDDSNESVALLGNGIFLTPEDISGEEKNFGINNPVIIMNACQTGQQGFSLSGIGGWAEKFLSAQVSAFVGTLWSVNDDTAYKFTRRLYENMYRAEPLDVAIKNARLAVKKEGDPTWLAYVVFCPPNTICKLGV